MGKSENSVEDLSSRFSVTRRGFVKSVAAAGTVAALYGCSKDENSDIIYGGGERYFT